MPTIVKKHVKDHPFENHSSYYRMRIITDRQSQVITENVRMTLPEIYDQKTRIIKRSVPN